MFVSFHLIAEFFLFTFTISQNFIIIDCFLKDTCNSPLYTSVISDTNPKIYTKKKVTKHNKAENEVLHIQGVFKGTSFKVGVQ